MLTLKKVKELVEAPSHAKRTPSPKMLFEEGIVLLRREFDQGSHLTVYNSGYVLFSAGKRNTVFHIHDCQGDYAYDAAEGKGDVIEEEYFENCEWHIRALFEGERKMEDGLHGDSLLLAAQNGKSVQTDLRQSLNPGKSNERKRQQTTPFPGGGLAVLVINGLCNDSQRPFQSEEQGLSEPDETPASVYGVCSRHWRSVLFSYARHAGNQQCNGRHGAADAAGIFLCSVREKRDAP